MAKEPALTQLTSAVAKMNAVDRVKLMRARLGEASIQAEFGPTLSELEHLRDFATTYAPVVHNDAVAQATASLNTFGDLMTAHAARPDSDFIAQRESFLMQMQTHLEEAKRWMPAFVAAAVMQRGFLEDEGIRIEYQRTVREMKEETAATLATVKQEADRAIEGAKKLAEEIETKARRTATRISVKEAQDQFTAASNDLKTKVGKWEIAAAGSILVLIVSAFGLMAWPLPSDAGNWPSAVYHTILRVFILSAVGALATFSFRMLRAHAHMAEKNLHRVRVANSVESFVNSALEPQQRDLILAKLAEAIVDFGDSGIIRHERDEMGSQVVTGDMLGRILAALAPRAK